MESRDNWYIFNSENVKSDIDFASFTSYENKYLKRKYERNLLRKTLALHRAFKSERLVYGISTFDKKCSNQPNHWYRLV